MHVERRAVLDVGTNSIKLLVADVLGWSVLPVVERSRQTRLGEGLYERYVLRAERIAETLDAAREFLSLARESGARDLRIVATSATREAQNRNELVEPLQAAWEVPVEVISGEQEADLAFLGVCTDERYRHVPLLIAEVGGGSTQILIGHSGNVRCRASLPLGTVRLLHQFPPSDPPRGDEHQACQRAIEALLTGPLGSELNAAIRAECSGCETGLVMVGTGGTASILGGMAAGLAAFDRQVLEQTQIPLEQIAAQEARLWGATLEARKRFVGLPANRADVILYGVALVHAVMRFSKAPIYRVSTRGVRFGALLASCNPPE